MGNLFFLVKYLGGAYLIWLGIQVWRSRSKVVKAEEMIEPSLLSSFLTGLFITLGDQKTILFYLGFFPSISSGLDSSLRFPRSLLRGFLFSPQFPMCDDSLVKSKGKHGLGDTVRT